MPRRPLVLLPDPTLRQVSTPFERIDDGVRALMDDMLATMYAAPGIGLAAIQVGVPKRLVVIDTAKDGAEPRPFFMANPEIVRSGADRRLHEEGCLSIPDVLVDIERPAAVTVRYVDRDGRQKQLDAEGLLATVIQHEIDHLDGRLIIDFLSRLKRDIVVRKFRKLARAGAA